MRVLGDISLNTHLHYRSLGFIEIISSLTFSSFYLFYIFNLFNNLFSYVISFSLLVGEREKLIRIMINSSAKVVLRISTTKKVYYSDIIWSKYITMKKKSEETSVLSITKFIIFSVHMNASNKLRTTVYR